jgi:GNAT superfamily N-acetyltransferase
VAFVIRRIRADEGKQLKRLRLGALADAPDAFAIPHAVEAAMPDDWWDGLATRRSSGTEDATFVAEADGRVVALAGVFRDGERGDAQLVSMWTAPEARRQGIARAMIATAVAWAQESGAGQIHLWVTVGNDWARLLYESAGFELTDDTQPLPSNPSRLMSRMRRSLR